MKSLGFTIESAFTEDDAGAERSIAQFKKGAELPQKTGLLQLRQHAHFAEERVVGGQQGFADMEARKNLLFERQHPLARPRQKGRRAAASRAAANHHCIEGVRRHLVILRFDSLKTSSASLAESWGESGTGGMPFI